MTPIAYLGNELDVFAHASNWKRYWSATIGPYLGGDVLEVGAGIGANTEFIHNVAACSSWTCLEPDPDLAVRIRERIRANPKLAGCCVVVGTTQDIGPRQYDTIIYIDVLEHIQDDRAELLRAARGLRRGGRIIVLAPAHQFLYTPFDRAIGHFRRYKRKTLEACTPEGCRAEKLCYLDSGGLLASLGNRIFLRQSRPDLKQIVFWDRVLVRLSRLLDPLTFHVIGKSILGIWVKA